MVFEKSVYGDLICYDCDRQDLIIYLVTVIHTYDLEWLVLIFAITDAKVLDILL